MSSLLPRTADDRAPSWRGAPRHDGARQPPRSAISPFAQHLVVLSYTLEDMPLLLRGFCFKASRGSTGRDKWYSSRRDQSINYARLLHGDTFPGRDRIRRPGPRTRSVHEMSVKSRDEIRRAFSLGAFLSLDGRGREVRFLRIYIIEEFDVNLEREFKNRDLTLSFRRSRFRFLRIYIIVVQPAPANCRRFRIRTRVGVQKFM